MKIGNVFDFGDNGERYVLVDETIQDGIKYFFATRVDENDEPLMQSDIFKCEVENDEFFLTPVRDEETFNYLSAVFISNASDNLY